MTETPAEIRDFWIAAHNEAQQNVAQLRFWLVMALQGPLDVDALEKIRLILDKTKP